MTRYQLDPSPSTTVDVFCRDLPPVLTVDPGDTVVLRSLNASGHLQPQTFPGENVPVMASKRRSGHCLTGPIAVRGAVPGEVLAVRFVSLRPGAWGYTVAAARDTPLTRRLGTAAQAAGTAASSPAKVTAGTARYVTRPTRLTLFLRTFLPWQLWRFARINLKMIRIIHRSRT